MDSLQGYHNFVKDEARVTGSGPTRFPPSHYGVNNWVDKILQAMYGLLRSFIELTQGEISTIIPRNLRIGLKELFPREHHFNPLIPMIPNQPVPVPLPPLVRRSLREIRRRRPNVG